MVGGSVLSAGVPPPVRVRVKVTPRNSNGLEPGALVREWLEVVQTETRTANGRVSQ